MATSEAPAPRLHPDLAEIYRQKVAALATLLDRDDVAEARELVRSLVDAIVLVPRDGRLSIEIRGELAGILALTAAGRASSGSERLAEQIKMVAGRGFEPLTFRL